MSKRKFKTEVSQLLNLIIHSLYSHREIFLRELVSNSSDALDKLKYLTLTDDEFKKLKFEPRIDIRFDEEDKSTISVADTGIGMNDEIKSHLFEPFFTTKVKGKGTGLGLATCYGIVKQNNGNIWVYSEPGQGATFKIYFPRIVEQPEDRADIASHAGLREGIETILVVEDEPSVCKMVVRILRSYGYSVLEAANGEEAIRVIEKMAQKIQRR